MVYVLPHRKEHRMTQPKTRKKSILLSDCQRLYTTLMAAVSRLDQAQLTGLCDAQGWSVKDHLAHLSAWEGSAIAFLLSKPRHTGLGIDEATYLSGSTDRINQAVYLLHKHRPLDEILPELRQTHTQLLELIESLDDAALRKPYRFYLPDEPGEGDGPPAFDVLYGNTAHHFSQHLAWIESLAANR
jgi:hypothetical protein